MTPNDLGMKCLLILYSPCILIPYKQSRTYLKFLLLRVLRYIFTVCKGSFHSLEYRSFQTF